MEQAEMQIKAERLKIVTTSQVPQTILFIPQSSGPSPNITYLHVHTTLNKL